MAADAEALALRLVEARFHETNLHSLFYHPKIRCVHRSPTSSDPLLRKLGGNRTMQRRFSCKSFSHADPQAECKVCGILHVEKHPTLSESPLERLYSWNVLGDLDILHTNYDMLYNSIRRGSPDHQLSPASLFTDKVLQQQLIQTLRPFFTPFTINSLSTVSIPTCITLHSLPLWPMRLWLLLVLSPSQKRTRNFRAPYQASLWGCLPGSHPVSPPRS